MCICLLLYEPLPVFSNPLKGLVIILRFLDTIKEINESIYSHLNT